MYEDIINMPRPVSQKHAPMTLYSRAAQFAPFSALTGLDGEMEETARLTERRVELDENQKEMVNRNICYVKDNIDQCIEADITYFLQDDKKDGGKYVTEKVVPIKIREFEKEIVLSDGRVVKIDDVISFNLCAEE